MRRTRTVLPLLSPLSADARSSCVQVPPPPRFRAPCGPIRDARIRFGNGYQRLRGSTAARESGLRYESQVQDELFDNLDHYHKSPEIFFSDDSGQRVCIPDGLFLHHDHVVVVEIKSQHMPEAWWQLKRLYEPVVRAAIFERPIHLLEVVKSYDPATPFPCIVRLVPSSAYGLKSYMEAPFKEFGVFQWRR